jgi:hypothetical protein
MTDLVHAMAATLNINPVFVSAFISNSGNGASINYLFNGDYSDQINQGEFTTLYYSSLKETFITQHQREGLYACPHFRF